MAESYDNFQFNKEGLSYNGQPLTDFNLSVVGKKSVQDTLSKKEQKSFLVEAEFTDNRPKLKKWVSDLRNIDLFKEFEINDCLISADVRKLLIYKLMYEAGKIPCHVTIDAHLGMQDIKNYKAFVFADYILYEGSSLDGIDIITHHKLMPTIKCDDAKELIEGCSSYIHLLTGVSEILYYGSLFAVVKPFLVQLNIPCGFVLALVGPPGYLKTTLVRLYALWLSPSEQQETGFHSVQRDSSILDKIDSLQGQNFLLDDIHRIKDTNKSHRQENRLDIVSRHVSEKNDCANVIITGETMEEIGIFSCIDRIFQIRIPKMNAGQIEELKKNISSLGKWVMPSVALAFAKSLMKNYDKVLEDIRDFYERNSINEEAAKEYATRTYIHAMFIRMTEYLFKKYLCDTELYIIKDESALDNAVKEQIQIQQTELQKIRLQEEKHDYIAELHDIVQAEGKYIQVEGTSSYRDFERSCALDEERIYITTMAIKNAFFNYYKRYISPKLVVDALHEEGILEEEPGSNGKQKNYNGKKHYVLNRRILVNYLHRNNCPLKESEIKKFIQGK